MAKAAFISHHGLQKRIRMQFCLKKAPSTFQPFMDKILSSVKCQFIILYRDNIVIFRHTLRWQMNNTRLVLTLLKNQFQFDVKKAPSSGTRLFDSVRLSIPVDLKSETTPLMPYATSRFRRHKLSYVLALLCVRYSANLFLIRLESHLVCLT